MRRSPLYFFLFLCLLIPLLAYLAQDTALLSLNVLDLRP
jgi:hypothetical protein